MHEGHRQRMYEKFSKAPKILSDHEILEMILYQSLPRINTNPLAHDLLDAFGDLDGVFSASEAQLCSVKGIGASTARNIAIFSELHRRINDAPKKKPFVRNNADIRTIICKRFEGYEQEKFEMYLLDKQRRLIFIKTMTEFRMEKVSVAPIEITETIIAFKPGSIIFAHNHPSGRSQPSVEDDRATGMLFTLMQMYNVSMLDHVIYANNEDMFSYFLQSDMEKLKEIYKLENLIKNKGI